MRNLILFLFTIIFILGLLIQPGCKTNNVQYTLTVTWGTGVIGVPAAGTYVYDNGEIVTYNYTPETGYENLVVNLNGTSVANSGLLTMDSDHTLSVTVTEIFNVNGHWTGRFIEDDGTGFSNSLNLTFSGTFYSGTVTGTVGAYPPQDVSGTYSISGDQIEFRLEYDDGSWPPMDCTGTIDDDNHMSGTFDSAWDSGPWTLERVQPTSR